MHSSHSSLTALILLILSLALPTSALLAAKAPDWAREVIRTSSRQAPDNAPALVLHKEMSLEVAPSGEWLTTHRTVILLLKPGSNQYAQSSVSYAKGTERILDCAAWVISPDGKESQLGKDEWIDHTLDDDDTLYTDFRRLRSGPRDTQPGDIFVSQITLRSQDSFGETSWTPHMELPLIHARLRVSLAANWECLASCIGSAPEYSESQDKRVQTWDWRHLAYSPAEPMGPELPPTWVIVRLFPSVAGRRSGACRTWGELARRSHEMNEQVCLGSPLLSAKARELTVDKPGLPAKIRALCEYVQGFRYAANYKNLGPGFGCLPRAATDVLSTQYGDCKDKVNVLRALLREIGVRAIPVLASTRDGAVINASLPSFYQFNHAIIALPAMEGLDPAATANVPGQGTLFFFDPTADYLRFGELPWQLRKSKLLLCTPDTQTLFSLPDENPAQRWARRVHLSLRAEDSGRYTGEIRVQYQGELAASVMLLRKRTPPRELQDRLSSLLRRTMPELYLKDFQTADFPTMESCESTSGLKLGSLGQHLDAEHWLVKPCLVGAEQLPTVPAGARRGTYILNPRYDDVLVELECPKGFSPDAIPPPINLTSSFGSYHMEISRTERGIRCQRLMQLEGRDIEASSYQEFRRFILAMQKAEQTPVLFSHQ